MTIHEPTLRDVLCRYRSAFDLSGRRRVATHLLSMLHRFPPPEKGNKRIRWLAFIQGALWCAGLLSIGTAKRDMYRVLNDGREPPEEER